MCRPQGGSLRRVPAVYGRPGGNARQQSRLEHDRGDRRHSQAVRPGSTALEYVSVRLDIEGKNGVEKFFHAFGIDRANKQLVPIDPNAFLNEIAGRCKPS